MKVRTLSFSPCCSEHFRIGVGEMKDDMEVIVKGGSVIFEKRGE
jgi:hypothetical protein